MVFAVQYISQRGVERMILVKWLIDTFHPAIIVAFIFAAGVALNYIGCKSYRNRTVA